MKRIFLFVLLMSAFTGLTVTASYALDPGCSQDMMDLLQRQADAVRARNRAYEREIMSREPSTLYLTCFDQALALSARLGYVFSDVVPPSPPPANTVVFTTKLHFPGWGAQHSLSINLDNAMSATPDGAAMLDNFLSAKVADPAVHNFMPPWTMPNDLTKLVTKIQPFIDRIGTFQANEQKTGGWVNRYIKIVKKINKLVDSLPTVDWDQLPVQEALYQVLIGSDKPNMKWLLGKIDDNRGDPTRMPKWLQNIQDAVMNTTMACTNMDDMWNSDNDFSHPGLTDYHSPEGKYYPLSPYYRIDQILQPPHNPPGATDDFEQEVQNPNDTKLLNDAWGDLTGPLSQPHPPGPGVVWPSAPSFPADANALQIIQQM